MKEITTLFLPMKRIIYGLYLLLFVSCGPQHNQDAHETDSDTTTTNHLTTDQRNGVVDRKKYPTDFLPNGFVVFERINGDLDKDGIDDCILIIKGTDKRKVVTEEYRGRLDRNRRGLIILLKKADQYELAVKNYTCFSSENEDGGVYYPPELAVEIQKGNLVIHYAHGRYGYWAYTFRYQNSDFELIAYEQSDNNCTVVNEVKHINFLTQKKQVKVNTNANALGGDEDFQVTRKPITVNKLIQLSTITDFDELDMSVY